MLEEILRACTAQGYKTDTAGIVSGLTEGIAFRADLPAGTLQLSVNVPPEKLPRAAQAARQPLCGHTAFPQ